MNAKGTYTVKKWEESSYQQRTFEKKMTRASAEENFSGEIEGTGFVAYPMFSVHGDPMDRRQSPASYVGLIDVRGYVQENREALCPKTTEGLKAVALHRWCKLLKAQAGVNSIAFAEAGHMEPIDTVVFEKVIFGVECSGCPPGRH